MQFLKASDLFEIKCKKCGSTDVILWAEECPECGTCITVTCNDCGSQFNPHNFTMVKE